MSTSLTGIKRRSEDEEADRKGTWVDRLVASKLSASTADTV